MVKLEAAAALEGVALASPKSISFAPVLLSIMLPGFKSRWITPFLRAECSPSQISTPCFNTCSVGRGPFTRRSARVSPSRCSMTRKCMPFCWPTSYSVQILGWFNEEMTRAHARNAAWIQDSKKDGWVVYRDRAVEPRVPRSIDLSHSTGAQRRLDFIRPKPCSRGKTHNLAKLYLGEAATQSRRRTDQAVRSTAQSFSTFAVPWRQHHQPRFRDPLCLKSVYSPD